MGDADHKWPGAKQEPVSKQFQPKKYKDSGQEWRMEKKEAANQPLYAYTPFKANSLNRATTPLASISEQHYSNGTLRRPNQPNPFVYPNQPPSRNALHEPPQSHSTPKATHHMQVRPESAAQMTKEQKLTWGRLPPAAGFRSASAMGRPVSRQSDTGIGHCVGSRYQSYCTLPRPEEMTPETLSEMHSNLHAFYPNGAPKLVSRPPSVATMVLGMPPPGMASDFVRPPSAFMAPNVVMPPPAPPKPQEIVSWNTLSVMCSMQVLCSLAIFGIGVGRMLEGAKWAIGIELIYALLVMVAGLSGIYAVRQRSYTAATLVFSLTAISAVLAIPPFIVGLFPAIPWAFSEATPTAFINKREPLELDFGLSLVILIQVLLSVVICVSGCRSFGVLCGMVEENKLHRDLHKAFHEMDLPQKA
uniref:Transmembrane protein n=1 Tax=Haemonchus contortus TaxID=6289 RepID=A0A7I4YTR4_HAECO